MTASPKRIAYLFTRYPVVSQTFCDSEMLELETRGLELTIGSIYPPKDTFRHERQAHFRAEVLYPPPAELLKTREQWLKDQGIWQERVLPAIEEQTAKYGESYKPAVRARNAAYFAAEFERRGVEHIHVHFANRATHTALFIKKLAAIPFSFTAHAQDFMVDLGNDDLLRELCREAEFVVAVSDWSRQKLAETCPDSAGKIVRIYNGIRLADFPPAKPVSPGPLKIVSIGRLIEFKGFHHLLGACAKLKQRGVPFECTIIGEGPWKDDLSALRANLGIEMEVEFAGIQTQEQVKAHLANSHVFALPCIVDSKGASDILPTVIMEAMACSLPVVSTWLVGVPEMVEDGKTGILVQPAEEDELADALARLANDPALRESLGKAGYEFAKERFQRENTTRDLLARFERSIEDGPERKSAEKTKLLYLVESWPCPRDKLLTDELRYLAANHPEVRILACGAPLKVALEDLSAEDRKVMANIDYLADGMVLEANWRHQTAAVRDIMHWRDEFEIDAERYFLESRRAIQIANVMEKRGIARIHGARSSTALTAWVAFKLARGSHYSFASEEDAPVDLKLLERLAQDAHVASVASGHDELYLNRPPRTEFRLGKFSIGLGRWQDANRTELYQEWAARLLA